MMRHRKIEELLAVYRSLDAGQRWLVDEHVRFCPSCAARLASYEEMDRRLAALPSPAPDRRLRTIVASTLAGDASAPFLQPKGRRPIFQALPLLVALVLVLALGMAALFMVRGFVRTPSVQPKIVRPVLVETPTLGSTPAALQTVTPYPTPAPSATPTPIAAPGIVERDIATATALPLLPSVTYSLDFATQEAAYAEMLATQTAQAALTPSPTATATPTWLAPPPESRSLSGLVYRTLDGLWLVGGDGKARLLSSQPFGALSSDGAQLLYQQEGDIWLADLASGDLRNLTEQPGGVAIIPQWWAARPDVVIFGSHPGGDYASFGFLTAVRTDGTQHKVLDGQEGSYEKPALGSDGQSIAYDRGGKPYLFRWGAGPEPIDLSRFSGTDLASLRMANPAWSPDGSKLAWLVYGELDEGSTMALAVMDLARLEARLVHPYLVQPMGGFPPAATWSPDGQWVAFSAYDQEPSQSGVWVVRADGSQERFLGAGSQPVWHPDGNRLAFSRFDAASGSRIVIADAVTWAVAELAEPKDGNVADWIRLDQVE